ncbi:MAG: hypothetical protein AAFT19_05665 [Pseudomonadota bacterium]
MAQTSLRLPSPVGLAGAGLARALRGRNLVLDAASYDLPGLTAGEIAALSGATDPGAIVVASPRRPDGQSGIALYADYDSLAAAPGPAVTQIAVAGLGASALGAGALARTLAEVTERPVAAVVAGYGQDDLLSEAMGGMVLFGAIGRVQQARQTLRRRLGQIIVEATQGPQAAAAMPPAAFATPAVATLVRLMSDPARRIDVVLAHSKGAIALATAYARLMRSARAAPPGAPALRRAAEAQIVTVGAVTAFPEPVRWVHQVLGQLDALGALNSQRDLPHETVPMAGHHLNTALPFHLDLKPLLHRVLTGAP